MTCAMHWTAGLNSGCANAHEQHVFAPFFQLLANRKLAPGAVLLVANGAVEVALQLLVSQPEFAAFASGFECLLGADRAASLSPELLAGLQAVGVKVVLRARRME